MAVIIRAALFDLGGTLMYSRDPWGPVLERGYQALAASLHREGFTLAREELPQIIRYHLDRYFARRDEDLFETTYQVVLRDMLAENGYENVDPTVIRRALDAFYEHTQANWALEEDALLVLRALEAGGYRLGIISNAGDNQDVFQLVERFHIEPFFDFILTSAACSYRKPHSRIFELALAHWNIPPQEVAMIGDSLDADIAGAKAMDIYSVWITRRASRPASPADPEPDASIRTLHELPGLLSRLA